MVKKKGLSKTTLTDYFDKGSFGYDLQKPVMIIFLFHRFF
jgi:hypothetical protein